MRQNSLLDISMYHIRLFLMLAEERNFSRVAALASITQPTLSKRIFQLEQTLDMTLFVRSSRPVSLTPEGEALYQGWRHLYEEFENAISEADRRRNLHVNSLTIASADSGNEALALPFLAQLILEKYPKLELNLRYLSFSKWRPKMLSGEIDVMLTTLFETDGLDSAFVWEQVSTCPKLVCMLKSNPLAKKESISYQDLKDQRFVMISPMESPEYRKYVSGLCASHGFEPMVARYVTSANDMINSLRRDDEVLVCDMFLRDSVNPLLQSFPLPETYSGMVAIWKRDNDNEFIQGFVDALKARNASA